MFFVSAVSPGFIAFPTEVTFPRSGQLTTTSPARITVQASFTDSPDVMLPTHETIAWIAYFLTAGSWAFIRIYLVRMSRIPPGTCHHEIFFTLLAIELPV
jgi:hypothetical protein